MRNTAQQIGEFLIRLSRESRPAMSTNQLELDAGCSPTTGGEAIDIQTVCPRATWRSWLIHFRHADILWTVGISFGIFVFNALQGVLLARILGPQARGEYATVIFYTQTLTYIGLLGTAHSIARRAAQHPDALPQLRRSSILLGTYTGTFTMAVVALLAMVALPAEKRYLAPLCVTCALFLPIEHIRLSILSVDHGSAAFGRFNANRLIGAAVFPFLLAITWTTGVGSTVSVAILFVLTPVVGLAYRFITSPQGTFAQHSIPRPHKLLSEGLPYAAAVLAADLFDRLDVFLVLWLASFTVQGYYAAAVPAAHLLTVAPIALALFTFNAGAARDVGRQPTMRGVLAVSTAILAMQLTMAVTFALVLQPLIVLVYGEAFRSAYLFALALLPAYALNGCALVAEGYLRGRNKAVVGVWSRVAGAAIMIASVGLLYPRWRELSIPIAASIGHAASTLWIFVSLLFDVRLEGALPVCPTSAEVV